MKRIDVEITFTVPPDFTSDRLRDFVEKCIQLGNGYLERQKRIGIDVFTIGAINPTENLAEDKVHQILKDRGLTWSNDGSIGEIK